MTAAKDKGTGWERDLSRSLRAFFVGRFGLAPFRPVQEGHTDVGDLHGLGPYVAQAKAWSSWEAAIREGLDGAERQRKAAGRAYGVAFVKRVRRSVGDGYAVQTVATWARVLVRLLRAEALLEEHAPDAYAIHVQETAADLERPFPRPTA